MRARAFDHVCLSTQYIFTPVPLRTHASCTSVPFAPPYLCAPACLMSPHRLVDTRFAALHLAGAGARRRPATSVPLFRGRAATWKSVVLLVARRPHHIPSPSLARRRARPPVGAGHWATRGPSGTVMMAVTLSAPPSRISWPLPAASSHASHSHSCTRTQKAGHRGRAGDRDFVRMREPRRRDTAPHETHACARALEHGARTLAHTTTRTRVGAAPRRRSSSSVWSLGTVCACLEKQARM